MDKSIPRWRRASAPASAPASASAWRQTIYCLASYSSSINVATIVNIMNILPGCWDQNWCIDQFRCEEGCRHRHWHRPQTVYCLASYSSSINTSTIVNIMYILPGRWDQNWWINQFRGREGCRHWPRPRRDDKPFIVWPVICPVLTLALLWILWIYYLAVGIKIDG